MTDEEEEAAIRKAVESFKTTSPSGKVPVGVSTLSLVLGRTYLTDSGSTVDRQLALCLSSPRSTKSSVTNSYTGQTRLPMISHTMLPSPVEIKKV
jgi:hypothetical protein